MGLILNFKGFSSKIKGDRGLKLKYDDELSLTHFFRLHILLVAKPQNKGMHTIKHSILYHKYGYIT